VLHNFYMKNDAVFALFQNRPQVTEAERSLIEAGFNPEQIRVLVAPTHGAQDFPYNQTTRVLTGAEVGAAVGLFTGAFVGLMFGLQTFTVPLLNSALALDGWSGALIGAIFGLAFGASSGALVGIGTPQTATERYAHYVDDGGILLSVHAESTDQARQAMEVLERCGGNDITMMNEKSTWSVARSHLQPMARV
jgi:hypothetical protein